MAKDIRPRCCYSSDNDTVVLVSTADFFCPENGIVMDNNVTRTSITNVSETGCLGKLYRVAPCITQQWRVQLLQKRLLTKNLSPISLYIVVNAMENSSVCNRWVAPSFGL